MLLELKWLLGPELLGNPVMRRIMDTSCQLGLFSDKITIKSLTKGHWERPRTWNNQTTHLPMSQYAAQNCFITF